MTMPFFKRAIADILKNRFLNFVTVITISLAILIASTFILFFVNTGEIINSWKKGLRIMAYLKPDIPVADLKNSMAAIQAFDGVQAVRFVSKQEALSRLKSQMKHQASLFENLVENPLPDSFEIRMMVSADSWQKIEALAARIASLDPVDEVEYGRQWVGRFIRIIALFRLAGYAMGTLFFLAAVFIVANTIRLVIYSRRQEVEIMRLVGATDSFIKMPFYIEGIIQGALGAAIGLVMLFISFYLISQSVEQTLFPGLFQFRFLSPVILATVLLGSMLIGWLGCYLALKQFLKI